MDTETSEAERRTEILCKESIEVGKKERRVLEVENHKQFLQRALGPQPKQMVALDASKPWMIYWAVNGLRILGENTQSIKGRISDTVLACMHPAGGIGGGYGQYAHPATSYAGLLALALSGDETAWDKIDRDSWKAWLKSLKQADGSFKTLENGEADSRSTYCALVIASLLDILTPELTENTLNYLASCQTYEGGFADNPYGEAHAGYAYCSLAGLCLLLGDPVRFYEVIDVDMAIRWLSSLQHEEGGFAGRTNKLVDGCYNHWAGGCWPFLHAATGTSDLYNRKALQEFVIYCNQHGMMQKGGLCDKPGCRPDSYHTNYVLCGLAGAQSQYSYEGKSNDARNMSQFGFEWQSKDIPIEESQLVNQVGLIHPIYVLPVAVAEEMHAYYENK